MATVKTFLDTRKCIDKTGFVKVIITHNRTQRLYTTNIKIETSEWAKFQKGITKDGLSGKVKNQYFIDLYGKLYETRILNEKPEDGFVLKARKVISDLGAKFTFEKFKVLFGNKTGFTTKQILENNVFSYFENKIIALKKEERIGSASAYYNTATSLKRFLNEMSTEVRLELDLPSIKNQEVKLSFDDVTTSFLKEYEKWMLKYGKTSKSKGGKPSPATSTTVGIYLRQFRAIFNDAIADEVAKKYPFGRRAGYLLPNSKNIKKAISKTEILKLLDHKPIETNLEKRSLDFWLFSYLSNGMNMGDVLRIRAKDYDQSNGIINFEREKTKNTFKTAKRTIDVQIGERQKLIIEKWKNLTDIESPYLFPFLNKSQNEVDKKRIISQFTKVTNQFMAKIAQELNINSPLTTYVARHSFSTILLQSEAPLAFISKALGHGKISTTEAYLGSFEDSKVKEYLKALV
jgi:integrase